MWPNILILYCFKSIGAYVFFKRTQNKRKFKIILQVYQTTNINLNYITKIEINFKTTENIYK